MSLETQSLCITQFIIPQVTLCMSIHYQSVNIYIYNKNIFVKCCDGDNTSMHAKMHVILIKL